PGHERVCVALGRDPAVALVHGGAARAGRARAAALRFGPPVRRAGGARRALHAARVPAPACACSEHAPKRPCTGTGGGPCGAALDRGEAFAVVGIPPGAERDVLKGTTVHVPIYADATYLFIFRTTANGIAVAINTLSSKLAAGGARTDGSLVKATLASASPAD